MGVNLKTLVKAEPCDFPKFREKKLAFDSYNMIYQFLSTIRQFDGTPLMDKKGRVTSHLSGLFYRNIKFFEEAITPIFVFDGAPNPLKRDEVDERNKRRSDAKKKYEKAKKEGDLEKALKFSKRSVKINDYHIESSKKLLDLMGVSWIQAPEDAEATCAYLTQEGKADVVSSQDWDALVFGSKTLVRNLAITGRKKVPGKDDYYIIHPEVVEFEKVLSELSITHDDLIDIAILVGTDFNDGIKGVGPKSALSIVQEGKMEEYKDKIENYSEIFSIFKNPNVKKGFKYEKKSGDIDALRDFLIREHAFSERRVDSGIKRLEKAKAERQSSLSRFF
jgi:flap endonuclease-1